MKCLEINVILLFSSVTVEDMNDNRPSFVNKTYYAQLYTNATIGRHIATLSATDKDKGQNGEISYYIIGESYTITVFHL